MDIDEKIVTDCNTEKITREYFDSLLIEMRHIDSVIPDTSLELYGEKFSTPIMTAALSHLHSFCKECPNGMVETAKGALNAGAVMWAGMGDEEELEAITATGARTIKIIKPYADNNLIFRDIKHAEKYGVLAVGMDIDHSFNRSGQYDSVSGYAMSAKTLDEIKEFVGSTHLPFIIKGVLSVKDAEKCLEAGVKGIVVSHHHGISDYAIPPLMVLPEIAEVINHQIPIFVDCGIIRGFDAFKALALGATAVSVGNAVMTALRKEGSAGVQKKIEQMNRELAGAMARTCSPDLNHIDPSVIWKR
jgi:isopentenyl diphosphate isomerase/L-lactate dehydrogenase-like FMN-dependent dehydrogenase